MKVMIRYGLAITLSIPEYPKFSIGIQIHFNTNLNVSNFS